MLLCAEMFSNCSILQANGKTSQEEFHAVRAAVNVLLMVTARAIAQKKERKKKERLSHVK